MANLPTLGARLKWARQKQNRPDGKTVSQGKVGRAANLSQARINQIESDQGTGEAKKQGTTRIVQIAAAIGVHPTWLATGKEPIWTPEGPNLGDSLSSTEDRIMSQFVRAENVALRMGEHRVPLKGITPSAKRGNYRMSRDGLTETQAPILLKNARDAYAIRLIDVTLSPAYEMGQILFVNPNIYPVVGDYVVVILNGSDREVDSFVNRLIDRTASKITLRQYEPPKDFDVPLKDVAEIHRVYPWNELLSWAE